jgi:hypothetical protein
VANPVQKAEIRAPIDVVMGGDLGALELLQGRLDPLFRPLRQPQREALRADDCRTSVEASEIISDQHQPTEQKLCRLGQ